MSRTTKLTRSFMVSLIRGTKLCNIHGPTLRWRNQDSVVTSVPVASVHKSKSVRVEDACPSRRRHVILPKAGRQRNTTPYFAACANFTNQEWTQRFEFRWFGHPSVRLQSLQYNLKSGEIVSETTSFSATKLTTNRCFTLQTINFAYRCILSHGENSRTRGLREEDFTRVRSGSRDHALWQTPTFTLLQRSSLCLSTRRTVFDVKITTIKRTSRSEGA